MKTKTIALFTIAIIFFLYPTMEANTKKTKIGQEIFKANGKYKLNQDNIEFDVDCRIVTIKGSDIKNLKSKYNVKRVNKLFFLDIE